MYPYDHAKTCTCPCPTCVALHREVLEHVGLLKSGRRVTHAFVFAHGGLAVEATAEEEDDHLFMGLYRDLGAKAQNGKTEPVATFGWLIETGDMSNLTVVRAASDPYGRAADDALNSWAAAQSITLYEPALRAPLRRGGAPRRS